METNLTLDRANASSLLVVHALWEDAYRFLAANGIEQWRPEQVTLAAVTYAFERSEMFLVRDASENVFVGTFFLLRSDPHVWKGDERTDAAYLHRLVVGRRYAGRGLGKQVLELAEAYMRNRGIACFRLDCMADNAKLNEFYRSAGFAYKGRTDGDGWSASLFEKELG
ncbi:GNAT family N-acetyltransferase [Paenibacillus sp.]|uniref:GNAT family N-acetyltransferase n=1 Tax=Paenibacillus sp. TaxID=58172 RepID=UPI002811B5F7|nr:GNAT family N-acetyltransferase [Paenibacillus sp.]